MLESSPMLPCMQKVWPRLLTDLCLHWKDLTVSCCSGMSMWNANLCTNHCVWLDLTGKMSPLFPPAAMSKLLFLRINTSMFTTRVSLIDPFGSLLRKWDLFGGNCSETATFLKDFFSFLKFLHSTARSRLVTLLQRREQKGWHRHQQQKYTRSTMTQYRCV